MQSFLTRIAFVSLFICILGLVVNEDYAAQKADEARTEEIRRLVVLSIEESPPEKSCLLADASPIRRSP